MGHAVSPLHDPSDLRLRFDGVVFPGVEYRIVDPATGEPVPPGTPGEYHCRAPSFFMGYMNQPELTQSRLTPDGLYKTGDLLAEHHGRYLRWEGRIKEIVRRGGLMIDAIEVSDLLSEHPRVAEAIVVGTPDARLGERAAAVVVPRRARGPTSTSCARSSPSAACRRRCSPRSCSSRTRSRGRSSESSTAARSANGSGAVWPRRDA